MRKNKEDAMNHLRFFVVGETMLDLELDLVGVATGGRALAREEAVGAMRWDADAFPVALLVRGFVTGVFARTFVSV